MMHVIGQCQCLMKFENTHHRIMNIIIDCYRILPVDNDCNSYFGFFPFYGFLELSFKRTVLRNYQGRT